MEWHVAHRLSKFLEVGNVYRKGKCNALVLKNISSTWSFKSIPIIGGNICDQQWVGILEFDLHHANLSV